MPWQQLASATGAKIRVIPVDDSGQVLLDEYQQAAVNDRTKIVVGDAGVQCAGHGGASQSRSSNMAHRAGAKRLGGRRAVGISHARSMCSSLDADFFVFSGHKIFGPTGIGVVYGQARCTRRHATLGKVAAT